MKWLWSVKPYLDAIEDAVSAMPESAEAFTEEIAHEPGVGGLVA